MTNTYAIPRPGGRFLLALVVLAFGISGFARAQDCGTVPSMQEGAGNGTAWPGGIVPYRYDAAVTPAQIELFEKALAEIAGVAGVAFIPRTVQADYITVKPNDGASCSASTCSISSSIGMGGGEQTIKVGSTLWDNTFHLCHEISHALGFIHEHQRPDREAFVTIVNANISQTACTGPCNSQFNLSQTATTYGPYDYLSYMHYNDTSFSANGQPVIITANPAFQTLIGQRTYMSLGDAGMLQARYGVAANPTISSVSPWQVLLGTGDTTVTVTGLRYYDGSPNGTGVQGTRVLWNGSPVATTWISKTEVSFLATAAMLQNVGCNSIQIENPAPAGGLSNTMTLNVISLAPVPGIFTGIQPGELLGSAVAGLGDVNGDGRDDVAAGCPGYVGSLGQVIAFSGATGAILWGRIGTADSEYGTAVAAFRDHDGDGAVDLLVGAPGYNSSRGRIQLLSGADGSVLLTFNGAAAGDRYGAALARAGDVNGDGTPDFLAGAPGTNNDTGTVYAFSGANGAPLVQFGGSEAGEAFGTSVAGGADFNSDGVPDIAGGAPFNGATNAGRVRLLFSPAFNTFHSYTGVGAYDNLGASLAVTQHLPAAGGAAILAGAPDYGALLQGGSGNGYVAALRVGLSGLDLVQSFTGDALYDRFGTAVTAAGDLDQDGVLDFAVGAPQLNLLGFSTGPGYVRAYSGRTLGVLATFDGAAGEQAFGAAVAEAFDTNADGRPDLIAGAPRADVTCADAGRARIISAGIAPAREKLMLTEIATGNVDAVEVTNFGAASASLASWRILWKDGASTYVASLSGNIPAGHSIVVRDAAGTFPETPAVMTTVQGFPGISTQTGDLAVALISPSGAVADEVRIASSGGAYTEGSLGGGFRGVVNRTSASLAGSLERIWGLDSNSGGDWTEEFQTSMGLENRSSGVLGTDPIAVAAVRINEVDDNPDYVELYNAGAPLQDLEGWTLVASAAQGQARTTLRPFPGNRLLSGFGHLVIGDNAVLPAELPPFVPYVDLQAVGGGNIPSTTSEFALALYDDYGRCVDTVRATATSGNIVHNHPRPPSAPLDFTGAAPRMEPGTTSVGRNDALNDTDTGSDWTGIGTRSMGQANPGAGFLGLPGTGTPTGRIDVRLNETAAGQGLALILNAGPSGAGLNWSMTFSFGHLNGTGPVLGLGAEAIDNYLVLSVTPPWFGVLDARGSTRLDVAPGLVPPGIQLDTLFILQSPASGLLVLTPVFEFDT